MKFIICLLFCLVGYSQIPNNIIIGDSQTPYVDKNTKKVERVVGLWKGGIDVPVLTKMVQRYKVSSNVQNVFLQNGQVSKHAVDVFLVFGNLFFCIEMLIKRWDKKRRHLFFKLSKKRIFMKSFSD